MITAELFLKLTGDEQSQRLGPTLDAPLQISRLASLSNSLGKELLAA